MVHFSIEQLLQGQEAFNAACQIHQAYVAGGADSWENRENGNYFKIDSIQRNTDGKYIVKLQQKDREFITEPMFCNELISTLCGGKFKSHGAIFNTKEASVGFRLEMVPQLLSQYGIEHDPLEIQDKIISGILNDNSKGLLATHWIHALDNQYGISDSDLMHILWCIYINYDDNASVLNAEFPLTEVELIQKDLNVLEMSQKILGLPSRTCETQTNINIGRFLRDLNHLLMNSVKESFGEDKQYEIEFLSEEDITFLAQYFQARHLNTTIVHGPLRDIKNFFVEKVTQAANFPAVSYSFRK